MLKEKLLRHLRKTLSDSDQSLLKLFTITEQKGSVVFRMPKTLYTLDLLWDSISNGAEQCKVPIIKTGLYATVEELDTILKDIEWMWKNHIPYGFMTMFAGEPGIGKSITVLDIARVITNGDYFPLSNQKCKRGKVFWIDTEMKQQLLNARSKTMGLDRSQLIIPSVDGNLLKKLDVSIPEHKEHIVSVVESENPELLVVDSLGHAHSRGENKIEDVRPTMDFLTALARDHSMGLIVVHHLNKGRPDEIAEVSLNRVRGSTDIVATPVVIFAIEKNGEDIKMRQIKNNIGRQQEPIAAKLVYSDQEKENVSAISYTLYTPPPPKKNKNEKCADWIRETLASHKEGLPLMDLVALGAGYGYSRGNLYAGKGVLGDEITVTGKGNRVEWHLSTFQDTDTINAIKKRSKRP